MALYRKYRPQKFNEVIGQEHIKKVLINSLKADKVGQAYLFSGSRGTGKTTMARLLAKALNCHKARKPEAGNRKSDKENPISDIRYLKSEPFEPCDECISCKEIISDSSLDVIEIDAASNRGIDEIRELREKIKYLPTSNRYKVFIIDEVHMLTKEAFNALLKTLEEPPKHAVFIMATTELHKVPDTILSRTQQFDFKRASSSEIIEGIKRIAGAEKIELSSEAIELIAKAAEGSQRDATTILEQVSSITDGEVSEEAVRDILGLVPREIIDDFIGYLHNNDVERAIDVIEKVYLGGYDLGQFNQLAIENLRQKMISEQNYQLHNYIVKFVEAGKDLKLVQLPQLPLELAVIESCNKVEAQNPKLKVQSSNSKLKTEEKIEDKNPITNLEVDSLSAKNDDLITSDPSRLDEADKVASNKVTKNDETPISSIEYQVSDLQAKWPEIVGLVASDNQSLSLLIKEAVPIAINNDKLQIAVKFKFYAERINSPDKYAVITNAIEKILGTKLALECIVGDSAKLNPSRLKGEAEAEAQSSKQDEEEVIDNNLVNDALEIFG